MLYYSILYYITYDAMVRRYNKSDRGLPNELREMHVGKLPQQACRELLAERMFKAHKTLSVRQTNMIYMHTYIHRCT